MNTKAIGDKTVALVMASLIKRGNILLLPFSDNERYDLVFEQNKEFHRVQCKTGRLKNGSISFKASSTYAHRGRSRKGYKGEADWFGVYCPETDKAYLIPVEEVGDNECSLRLEPTKNNQTKNIRWAKDYEI